MPQLRNFLNYRIDFLTETYTRRTKWASAVAGIGFFFLFCFDRFDFSIVSFNFIPILTIYLLDFSDFVLFFSSQFFFCSVSLFTCCIFWNVMQLRSASHSCLVHPNWIFTEPTLSMTLNQILHLVRELDGHHYTHTHINASRLMSIPLSQDIQGIWFHCSLFSASLFSLLECILNGNNKEILLEKYGCDIVLFIGDTF